MDAHYCRQYLGVYPLGVSTTAMTSPSSTKQRTQSEYSDPSGQHSRPQILMMVNHANITPKTNNLNKITMLSPKNSHTQLESPAEKGTQQHHFYQRNVTQSQQQQPQVLSSMHIRGIATHNRYEYVKPDSELETRQSKSLGTSPDKENIFYSSNIILPTPKPQTKLNSYQSPIPSPELLQIANKSKLNSPEIITVSIPPNNPNKQQPISTIPPDQSPSMKGRKTLVLDLDETLVHSSMAKPQKFDIEFKVSIRGKESNFYMNLRPGVHEFLQFAAKHFEVFVWTASVQEYASVVINYLDPTHELIAHRLFRNACKQIGNGFVKDLSMLNRDLKQVIIIDNLRTSFRLHQENGIQIEDFIDNSNDTRLNQLIPFLEYASNRRVTDVRDVIQWRHRFDSSANSSKIPTVLSTIPSISTHNTKTSESLVLPFNEKKSNETKSTITVAAATTAAPPVTSGIVNSIVKQSSPPKNRPPVINEQQETLTEESRVMFDAFTYSKFEIEESRIVQEKVHNQTQRILSDISQNSYTYSQNLPARLQQKHSLYPQQYLLPLTSIPQPSTQLTSQIATTTTTTTRPTNEQYPKTSNSIVGSNLDTKPETHKLDSIRVLTPRFEERLSLLLQSQQSPSATAAPTAPLNANISNNENQAGQLPRQRTPAQARIQISTNSLIADSISLSPARETSNSSMNPQIDSTKGITMTTEPIHVLGRASEPSKGCSTNSTYAIASSTKTTTTSSTQSTESRASHNDRYQPTILASVGSDSTSTTAHVRLLKHRPTLSMPQQSPYNIYNSPYSSPPSSSSSCAAKFLQFPSSTNESTQQSPYVQQQYSFQDTRQQLEQRRLCRESVLRRTEVPRIHSTSFYTPMSDASHNSLHHPSATPHNRSSSFTNQDSISLYSCAAAPDSALDHHNRSLALSSPSQNRYSSPIEQLLGDLLISSPPPHKGQLSFAQKLNEITSTPTSSAKSHKLTHTSLITAPSKSEYPSMPATADRSLSNNENNRQHHPHNKYQRTPSTASSPNSTERYSRESSSLRSTEQAARVNPIFTTAATIKLSCFYDTPILVGQSQLSMQSNPYINHSKYTDQQPFSSQLSSSSSSRHSQSEQQQQQQQKHISAFSSIDRVFHLI